MAIIPSAEDKHNDVEISANAPISETLLNKVGANINSLIDDKDTNATNIAANASALSDLIDFQSITLIETSYSVGDNTAYTVPALRHFSGYAYLTSTNASGMGAHLIKLKRNGLTYQIAAGNATTTPSLTLGVGDDSFGLGDHATVVPVSPVALQAGDEVIFTRAGAINVFFNLRGYEVKEQV